jgi:hypothetical protein
MNLGILGKLGFIERRGDIIVEGPLLDLLMDTDLLKERIINGALADVFKVSAPVMVHVPRDSVPVEDEEVPEPADEEEAAPEVIPEVTPEKD